MGRLPVTTGRILGVAAVLLIAGLLALFWHQIDVDAIHAYTNELSGWGIFMVISIAPLLGVPVAMLHVIAGVRYGVVGGLVVVTVTTLIQHLAGWWLVRVAPHVFAERLSKWRRRFPSGAHAPITVFCCLLPGMPYSIQLYLLPLLGVPVWMLVAISVPLHVVRAVISVLGGHLSDHVTPGGVAALVLYYCVLTLICTLTLKRIRTVLRHEEHP